METLSDVNNTQYSYSLPSPNFAQKKLFNSKADYSFLQKGHKGDNDLDEESFIHSSLDKSQTHMIKPNLNIQNVRVNEGSMHSKLKNILDIKRQKQDNPLLKPSVVIQDQPLVIEEKSNQHLSQIKLQQQKNVINLWKKDMKKVGSPHLQNGTKSNMNEYLSKIKNVGLQENQQKLDNNSGKVFQIESEIKEKITQEEMKIRNIFFKKFEVRRDLKIKKFMRILISRFRNRKLNLKEEQLNLINDKAYFYQTSSDNQSNCVFRYSSRVCSYFSNVCQFIPILNPTNPWKLFWDFFMITVLGIFLYTYSALMFFAQAEQYIEQSYLKFAFISFCIDILLKFNTSYYSKDSIIQSRMAIAEQQIIPYLKYHLLLLFPITPMTIFLKIYSHISLIFIQTDKNITLIIAQFYKSYLYFNSFHFYLKYIKDLSIQNLNLKFFNFLPIKLSLRYLKVTNQRYLLYQLILKFPILQKFIKKWQQLQSTINQYPPKKMIK